MMIRTLVLSIIIALGLVALFAMMIDDLWHIQVISQGIAFEPFEVLLGLSIGSVVMVIIGVVVTISVIAAIAFAILVAIAALAFAGMAIGWPVLLAGLLIWLLVRDNKKVTA